MGTVCENWAKESLSGFKKPPHNSNGAENSITESLSN